MRRRSRKRRSSVSLEPSSDDLPPVAPKSSERGPDLIGTADFPAGEELRCIPGCNCFPLATFARIRSPPCRETGTLVEVVRGAADSGLLVLSSGVLASAKGRSDSGAESVYSLLGKRPESGGTHDMGGICMRLYPGALARAAQPQGYPYLSRDTLRDTSDRTFCPLRVTSLPYFFVVVVVGTVGNASRFPRPVCRPIGRPHAGSFHSLPPLLLPKVDTGSNY